MASLPKSFNLAEPIPSLPDGALSQLITCRPISGNTFAPQSIIEVDLGNRGWCDPQSIAIRYKVDVTADATSGSAVLATPVYTPFQRLSVLVGGASIDSINSYNLVSHVLTTGNLDIGQKYGLQSSYAYSNTTGGNMQFLDGRFCSAGATSYFASAPLIANVLSNSEKMLPLFAMPQIRFQFTLDSLANMFAVTTGASGVALATAFSISNFELCYSMIDMGSNVEKMVYDMPSISIKTHGLSNSAVAVASGASGSNSYVFNQRFASIRSAFACPTVAVGNKWADICDLTNGNGDYQFLIGNQAFPQAPLSMVLNNSGVQQETRRAFGNLYDKSNSFSINSTEWSKTVNGTVALGNLYYEPGKTIIGVSLDKVQSGDHVMMSGASTYNTPISVNVSIGSTPTNQNATLNLILDYDAILVLDPRARQLSVRS